MDTLLAFLVSTFVSTRIYETTIQKSQRPMVQTNQTGRGPTQRTQQMASNNTIQSNRQEYASESGKGIQQSTTQVSRDRGATASHIHQEGTTASSEDIQTQICQVFVNNCQEAQAIAKCESHFKSTTIGHNKDGSIDVGIFQINSIHFPKIPVVDKVAYLTNIDNNIHFAYELWKQQGFNPWTCKKVLALNVVNLLAK